MKFTRSTVFGGIASIAMAIALPNMAIAGSEQGQNANSQANGNTVHRVVHSLASSQQYSQPTGAGYKWNQNSNEANQSTGWMVPAEAQSGYKWGDAGASNNNSAKNFAEQSGKRWGRRDHTEQAGKRWGRRDHTEQAGKRWGRRDHTEQAGKRWGRR